MQNVLILGAGGFIGSHLVTELARTPGIGVLAGVRTWREFAPAVTVRLCDATDNISLKRAMAGAECVVNCIAGRPAAMVAATERLCRIARIASVRRIVHISSMAVYGDATGEVGESTQIAPPAGSYAAAKYACEQFVRDYVRSGGDAVVMRPGCVHGPGSEQWTARIGRLLQAGRIGDLGALGDGLCNLTYIDDLVAAVIAALQVPHAAGQAFNVADPEPETWNQYFLRFGRLLGATPIRRIPRRRLMLEAKVLAPGFALARKGLPARWVPDPLPPSLLRLFQQEIRLSNALADSVLGFPRTAPKRALAEAAEWYRRSRPRAKAQVPAVSAGLVRPLTRDAE